MVTPLMITSHRQSCPVIIRTSDVGTTLITGTPRRAPISWPMRYSNPPVTRSGDEPVYQGAVKRSVPMTSTPGVRVRNPAPVGSGSVVVVVVLPLGPTLDATVVGVVVVGAGSAGEHAVTIVATVAIVATASAAGRGLNVRPTRPPRWRRPGRRPNGPTPRRGRSARAGGRWPQ